MPSAEAALPAARLVLLDANALMTAARLRLDLGRELAMLAPGWTPVLPSCVARELLRLGKRRHAGEARALGGRFASLPADGEGDDALLSAAGAGPLRAVLTNDRALRRRLRRKGIPVVYVRGSAALALDGTL